MAEAGVAKTEVERRYRPQMVAEYFAHAESEMMAKLRQLTAVESMCSYEIGVRLYRVKTESLWRKMEHCINKEEYPTFGAWVYHELGFSARKGRYLSGLAEKIDQLRIPPEKVSALMKLGWSKAYHLLRADDSKQVDEWYGKCLEMSERETIGFVRLQLGSTGEEGLPEEENVLEKPITVKAIFGKKSQYTFWTKALAIIERKHGIQSTAEAMSILGANFLATSMSGGEEANAVELDVKLKALEEQYGVHLAVIVPEDSTTEGEDPEGETL